MEGVPGELAVSEWVTGQLNSGSMKGLKKRPMRMRHLTE